MIKKQDRKKGIMIKKTEPKKGRVKGMKKVKVQKRRE